MGLTFHEIARGDIEIPRDFTGRDITGQTKHGTPRDGIEISRHFTGRDPAGRQKDRYSMGRD